jgi:cytochrome c peroxidase
VIAKICTGSYADQFKQVCGPAACEPDNVNAAYDCVGYSIAAYEASPESNAFTSKYDYAFKGKAKLTKKEQKGYALFRGKGKCNLCHVANGQKALFTDYTFDNLGIPRNPENPFYDNDVFNPLGENWIDLGLGGFLEKRPDWFAFASENYGKHKVPTLRNVDKWDGTLGAKAKAYGHNGYFKSLKVIVNFYNTRDVKPQCPDPFTTEADALDQGCWPAPEVAANVNTAELGDLGLTSEEEDALVAFLMALSDGYIP